MREHGARRYRMAPHWWCVLALLALPLCLAPALVLASPAAGVPDGWQTYQSDQAGYVIGYPPGWAVDEQTGPDGHVATVFAPPDGGSGVTITSHPSGPDADPILDDGSVHCQATTVADLAAVRCFDAIALTAATTLAAGDRTYTIAGTVSLDEATYQAFLESFSPLQPVVAPVPLQPAEPHLPVVPPASRFADAEPRPTPGPLLRPAGACPRGCDVPPPGCTVKGTILPGDARVYLLPGQPGYDAVQIDVQRGERWFCTPVEAQLAGWSASKVPLPLGRAG